MNKEEKFIGNNVYYLRQDKDVAVLDPNLPLLQFDTSNKNPVQIYFN